MEPRVVLGARVAVEPRPELAAPWAVEPLTKLAKAVVVEPVTERIWLAVRPRAKRAGSERLGISCHC